jgi:hypothetical protein
MKITGEGKKNPFSAVPGNNFKQGLVGKRKKSIFQDI